MASLPDPQHSTARAIYKLHELRRDEAPRPYLGAAELGETCARRLWYRFRWAEIEAFEGRVLRLFETGNREETRLLDELRAIGVTVHDRTEEGGQHRVEAIDGHVAGHMDAAIIGLPEAPKTFHVFESKTSNTKAFSEIKKKGVKEAKPKHYAQVQMYMGGTGMDRALYVAVCKETDELYTERVPFVSADYEALLHKAETIVYAAEPPSRISEDPAWYECKFCPFHALCHGQQAPQPTCRSCAHATPVNTGGGAWYCEHHRDDLTYETQRVGCEEHRYIPATVDRFLELSEAFDHNVVVWRNKLTGAMVRQPDYASREIRKATDKRQLGDEFTAVHKQRFDAEVVERARTIQMEHEIKDNLPWPH